MAHTLDYGLYPCCEKQIRLLKLQRDDASDASDALRFTMHVVSLDDAPAYAAVSYVWGRGHGSRTINVGEFTLDISVSAETALRYLSQMSSIADIDAMIWIDTVCVDQGDDADRSHQVASMADVYRSAEEVLIFLGPPFEGSGEIMLSIARTVREFDLEHSLKDPNKPRFEQGNATKLQECLDCLDMETLAAFFSSPWFMRLWVVQESVLSKRATFFYGSVGVNMTSVLILATYLRENYYTRYESRGQKVEQIAQMEYATELYDTRLQRTRLQFQHGLSEHEVGSSLGNLLSSFHDRQNLDARDKIYAILGLCWPSTAAQITPDYTKPLGDIYLHASSLAFTETGSTGSINILHYARNMGHKPTSWYKENHWPTWLPCWQYPFDLIKNPSMIAALRSDVHELLDSGQENIQSTSQSQLSFSGVVIDTVVQTTSPMIRNKEEAAAQSEEGSSGERIVVRIEDVEEAITKCMNLDAQVIWLPGDRSLISIIGETLVAGDYGYDTDPAVGEAHFHSVLQYTSHKSSSHELSSEAQAAVADGLDDPWTYLTGFDVHTTFRVCFLTSRGYFGLGSEYMLAGDLICVPQGSQTPYIIREEDDHYILIGQCYLCNEYIAKAGRECEQRRFNVQ